MAVDYTWVWILLFAMLGVLAIFIAIAANRKLKGFRLIVLKDFRNPTAPPKRYWALFDSSKDAAIKLYSNIFRPMKNKIIPPFDLSAYSYNRMVFCLQGISGHPEDENIVPVHVPVVGQAGAVDYSNEISGAVLATLRLKETLEKKNLKIGDVIEYENKQYTINDINYNGIELMHKELQTKTARDGSDVSKMQNLYTIVSNLEDIDTIKVRKTESKNRKPELINFFNPGWVFQNLGVVPVEDVNVVLQSEKSSVASFNSKVNDRVLAKSTIWTKYPWLIPMAIMTFVVVIGSTIFFYNISQSTATGEAGISSTAIAAIEHISGITPGANGAPPGIPANMVNAT